MIISSILFLVIGYLVGLHAPLYISIPLIFVGFVVVCKQDGIGSLAMLIGGVFPYTIGTVLSILIYHTNFGAVGDFIKFVFTGA